MSDAEHYNQQYVSGDYRARYTTLPGWAKAMNQYGVDYVIALLGLRPENGLVLDLGTGVGQYLEPWEYRGFKVRGREISAVAVGLSGRDDIDVGDACDLSGYSDDQFQLVFSSAFLEHVDDADVSRLLSNEMRIAPLAAHYIAHEAGSDPGHINIKTPDEWDAFFRDKVPITCVVGNPLVWMSPAFLHMRELPSHVEHATKHYIRITTGGEKNGV